ncbi:MAG: RnfABCDGE type electron transport complex subunit B [Pseudomonadota bacterium]|nr:RnfABCDGE type electron transport complex subunit B [Pseudomonadota bacterium]
MLSVATSLTKSIDALLPQTQCRRCGFEGCQPYAEAIAQGEAINRCPPGGETVLRAIAELTARPIVALDPSRGPTGPPQRAVIDETRCIGCALCIAACPVDAIAGGPKRMHAVIAALCSGCELCVPSCPVDCIGMISAGRQWSRSDASSARERHDSRAERETSGAVTRLAPSGDAPSDQPSSRMLSSDERKSAAALALARARARRAAPASPSATE